MKKLIFTLALLMVGNLYAAVGTVGTGFDINLGSAGFAAGGFNRASNIIEVHAYKTNVASYKASFGYASGSAYFIKTAPEKSTLIGISCHCQDSAGADQRITMNATTRFANNTGPALQAGDREFFENGGAQPWVVMDLLPANNEGCAVSRVLNINLTEAFMPARQHFGISSSGTTFTGCVAYIKEE